MLTTKLDAKKLPTKEGKAKDEIFVAMKILTYYHPLGVAKKKATRKMQVSLV